MSFSESARDSERKMNPEIKRITADSIKDTLPPRGETDITLQRHGDYIRDPERAEVGSLTEEAQERIRSLVRGKIGSMLRDISPDEPVFFLVTGSSTAHYQKGQRSIETAEIIRKEIARALDEHGLGSDSLLNNRSVHKGVPPISKVEAPHFVDDMTPYFEFLLEKHGGKMGPDFWSDFESDTYKEDRIRLGAEGPDEIDARFVKYINALRKFSDAFHRKNKDRRLVIWNVSHYDTISPYVKRHVDHSNKDRYLPVDLGGGITLETRNGKLVTNVNGYEYNIT